MKTLRGMIVPIIITAIVVLYCVAYFGFIMWLLDGAWRYLLGLLPLALAGVMIYVCIERVREIKKGEENDLSKY